MKRWKDLPKEMQIEEIRPYYEVLRKKRMSLTLKRVFDIVVSAIMLVFFSPVILILAIAIKIDSPGPVFYRQVRVTQYGRTFKIHKFRSMYDGADKKERWLLLVTIRELPVSARMYENVDWMKLRSLLKC